jgi:predicted nuclease of predicted toxin-antitoxin system
VRFKLDENLPAAAKAVLAAGGHDVVTVVDERLGGRDDDSVASAALTEGRVLITFDLEFADERRYPPGSHPGTIVLRLRSQDRDGVVAVLGHCSPARTWRASPEPWSS